MHADLHIYTHQGKELEVWMDHGKTGKEVRQDKKIINNRCEGKKSPCVWNGCSLKMSDDANGSKGEKSREKRKEEDILR